MNAEAKGYPAQLQKKLGKGYEVKTSVCLLVR